MNNKVYIDGHPIPFPSLNIKSGAKKVLKAIKKVVSILASKIILAYEEGDRIHRNVEAHKQEIYLKYMRDGFPHRFL